MKKLELVVSVKRSKSKEFKQCLKILKDKIEDHSSSFEIDESEDALTFSLLVQWETDVQMHQALQNDVFKILSGAMNSLCEKTIFRIDDKQVGNHISNLTSIVQAKL